MLVLLGFFVLGSLLGYLLYISRSLPNLNALAHPDYDLPTSVYDRDGQLITEFYTKRRVLISYGEVPNVLINAVVSIEDDGFFTHNGLDFPRIVKAFLENVIEMDFVQGASTITQQTAKLFLLSSKKNITRKLQEIILAIKIDNQFKKEQILELYLNKAYFGHGAYGVEASSRTYFSKSVRELNLAEAALIAGLLQSPSKLDPSVNMPAAIKRRNLVLKRMAEEGYISEDQAQAIYEQPIILNISPKETSPETSYFCEHVRQYILKKYGENRLYQGGLKVYTTMDLNAQISAYKALREGLSAYDRRQGFRGPIKNIFEELQEKNGIHFLDPLSLWKHDRIMFPDKYTDTDLNEILKKEIHKIVSKNRYIIGENVLGIVSKLESNQVLVDFENYKGRIPFEMNQWARPVDYSRKLDWQSHLMDLKKVLRVGDVIELEIVDYHNDSKEFILTISQHPATNGSILTMNSATGEVLAMVGGYDFSKSEFNRATQTKREIGSLGAPLIYSLTLENGFTPTSILPDTGGSNIGEISLRDSFLHLDIESLFYLERHLGWDEIMEYTNKFGLKPDNWVNLSYPRIYSITGNLLGMVRAYGVFANSGRLVEPIFISKITDYEGNIIEKNLTKSTPVVSQQIAYSMTELLREVVKNRTGWHTKKLRRPVAGNAGTTDKYIDAWFIGYTSQLITGVFVGFDDGVTSLGGGETGENLAAPIWLRHMENLDFDFNNLAVD